LGGETLKPFRVGAEIRPASLVAGHHLLKRGRFLAHIGLPRDAAGIGELEIALRLAFDRFSREAAGDVADRAAGVHGHEMFREFGI
jgi:hypothetical protein